MKKNFKESLRVRLIAYYLLLISIPLIAIILISNYFYNKSIDEQATNHTSQMILQVQSNVSSFVNTMDNIIAYMEDDPAVKGYLRLSSNNAQHRINYETQVRQIMNRYTKQHPEISGILISNKNNIYASNEFYRIARYPLRDDSWYKQAEAQNGEMLLISKPIGRNIRNWKNHAAYDILSVTKAIYDKNTNECLGVILIDMHTSIIEQQIKDVTLGKSGYVFIMDNLGKMVYAPANKTVYRVRPEWLKSSNRTNIQDINGKKHQIIFATDDITNWKTVGVFSYGELLEPMATMQFITILIVLFTLFFAIVTAVMFSATITKPISKLRKLMLSAENGNLDVSFEGYYTGEIAGLGNSFNAMMNKIRGLIELVYVEQQHMREAELKTLQAQIKPHFLYNTLDTIKWMAKEINAKEIVSIVGALTRLFRIGISKGKEIIPLKSEIEHIESYLFIQKLRYEEKLNYKICYDESLSGCIVQKLILQPLVENAIYHGIKEAEGVGYITIKITKEDSTLIMKVIDNGVGISEEKCKQINELFHKDRGETATIGYGIFNVHDRIYLSYGGAFGLTIEKNAGSGTTVTINHPIIIETTEGK